MNTHKLFCLCLALALAGTACGQSLVRFRISRPLCLFNFLETAAGEPSSSPTYRDSVRVQLTDDTAFARLVRDFSSIQLYYPWSLPGYPKERNANRSSLQLLKIAAVQSSSTGEFLQRAVGIIPNTDWLALRSCMERAEPFYDRVVDTGLFRGLALQQAALEKLAPQISAVFRKLKTFYGSTWGEDMPFTVALYPIPSSTGVTTATPHANSLVMGLMRRERDYVGRMSVGVHEICHVLYGEQPALLQNQLDTFFKTNPSLHSRFAAVFIDEALATAGGNGWTYKMLAGHEDTGSWYNNDYINRFAKALYPMTVRYIETGRTIDRAYVDSSVVLFEKTFPDAPYEFSNLLNSLHLYTDNDRPGDLQFVSGGLRRQFNVSSVWSAAPVTDPQSLQDIRSSSGTQLIVLHTRHRENFEVLKKEFPELKQMGKAKNEVFVFRDQQKRPVILLNLENREQLDAGLKMLKKLGKMKPGLLYESWP